MCRIAGIIHPNIDPASLEKMTTAMCELLKHGGPDDGGVYTSAENHLSLGNRRLSLLDLSTAGHQPMQYGERYTITYNGELYNFRELKKELQSAGMAFANNTDTEVILAGFAKWNVQFFSRLNGMFAFALWDNEEKKLYLVRDGAGIKPLYYSTHTGGLAFSSEIRAFAPVAYLQEVNNDAAVFQLAYGYVPEPVTTLKHVRPVPKGTFLTYDSSTGNVSLRVFSFFSFSDEINNIAEARAITKRTIADAVSRQMVADAPIGVFLSGGIDSAVIANLAGDTEHSDLHTLSIHFSEQKYSEKKYQDLIADKLQSKHHSFLLEEKDFHENFPKILENMDMPSSDGINTWFISKFAAAEGLKAVLSGIGADELFGGYPSFRRIDAAMMLQRMPNIALNTAGKAHLKKLGRISYLRIKGIRGLYLFLRGHFTPPEIAAQLNMDEAEVWRIIGGGVPSAPVDLNAGNGNMACILEFYIYMQDQLLRDADVMSMAHGLEIRVPFLDNEVIRPVFSMDEKIKFSNSIPKELLVTSFRDKLPEEIWKRKKMGFSLPFAEWLRKSEYIIPLKESKNKYTRKAFADFMSGQLHWSRIMSLIVLNNELFSL